MGQAALARWKYMEGRHEYPTGRRCTLKRVLALAGIFAAMLLPDIAYSRSKDLADKAIDTFDKIGKCNGRLGALHGRHAREGDRDMRRFKKIGKTDYPALCDYGRKVGVPRFKRQIAELRAHRHDICWDGLSQGLLEAQEQVLFNYEKAVDNDCEKARRGHTRRR